MCNCGKNKLAANLQKRAVTAADNKTTLANPNTLSSRPALWTGKRTAAQVKT